MEKVRPHTLSGFMELLPAPQAQMERIMEILLQNDTTAMTAGADDYMISETIQFATIVVATVPILAIYPFIQRYFVKGVMIGAVKG